MRILNAIVASDRTNGIGFTKKSQGYGNVSLPWKLAGEFKYYCEMVEFKEENAGAKKNVLICGPAVFKEASLLHPEGYILYKLYSIIYCNLTFISCSNFY